LQDDQSNAKILHSLLSVTGSGRETEVRDSTT